jgi:hypothetical protein
VYLAKANDREPKPKASIIRAVVSIISCVSLVFGYVPLPSLAIFSIFRVSLIIFCHLFH